MDLDSGIRALCRSLPDARARHHPAQPHPRPALRRQQLVRRPPAGAAGDHLQLLRRQPRDPPQRDLRRQRQLLQRRHRRRGQLHLHGLPQRRQRHLRQPHLARLGRRHRGRGRQRERAHLGQLHRPHRHRHRHHGDLGGPGVHLPQRLRPQPLPRRQAGRRGLARAVLQVGLLTRARPRAPLHLPQHDAAAGQPHRRALRPGRRLRHRRHRLRPAHPQHVVDEQHLPRVARRRRGDEPARARQRVRGRPRAGPGGAGPRARPRPADPRTSTTTIAARRPTSARRKQEAKQPREASSWPLSPAWSRCAGR